MSTPQPQQNLIAAQVALFEHRTPSQPPFEHGNCKCAIAAQPNGTDKPRYKLVCYSEGSAACVASIGPSNENSIQFEMQTTDYASFKDDDGKVWSMMFLRTIDVEPFLAHLAVAFFGASGSPMHSATIADYAPTGTKGSSVAPSHSGKKVDLGRRIKTRYTAYAIRRATDPYTEIPKISELLESNGEAPFSCDAVQSPFGIPSEGKGFESSLLGASEGCWRAVVIPQSMPRSCNTPMLNIHTVVFILQITRIVADNTMTVPGAAAVSNSSFANALVTVPSARVPDAFGNSRALVLAGAPQSQQEPVNVFGTHTQGQGVGSGIPAEHMLFVQKLAGQVNTAVSTLKDMQDRIDAMNQEYKQHLNRPKPSVLSAAALEDNVKKLCMEHERLRDELLRREELIRALDDRNRDLQKAVDKAALAAQQLLDEKKKAVTKTSDNRLDSDRATMKIQESILRARSERDDLARHLQTVKRLLDASDQELRDTKGKKEVVMVQLQAMTGKLDASEENLGEERSRRKAFEAKVAALTDEIRNSTAELHLKNAQVEDWRRKADSERVHYMQLMEDERSRRGVESAQLRSEIVDELQQRDRRFEADRARTQQEHYSRGHDEGKEVGRKTARADYDVRMQELALEAQRAKTELDSYKDQLREAQDAAQSNHRRLDAAISALKQQVEEGTRSKAQLEFQVQRAQAQVRSAEDSLFLGISALAHRLIMPVAPEVILEQLERLRAGKIMDLTFQENNFASATTAAKQRRQGIVFDTMLTLHEEGLNAIFNASVQQMQQEHDNCFDLIARLWEKRQADERYAVVDGETTERAEFTKEEHSEFEQIVEYRDRQTEERRVVEEAFDKEYAIIVEEEIAGWKEIEAIVFEQQIKAQNEIIDEETAARAIIENDEEPSAFQKEILDEAASDLELIKKIEEFRAEQQKERAELEKGETEPRVEAIEKEQDQEWSDLIHEFNSTKPKPKTPTPPPTPPRDPTPEPPAKEPTPPREPTPEPVRNAAATAPVPPPPFKKQPNAVRAAADIGSDDSDDEEARREFARKQAQKAQQAPPAPAPKQKAAPATRSAADVDEEQQDNTRESVGKGGFVLPVQKQNPNRNSLFGGGDDSDSDAEGGRPAPAPKPVAKPAAAPATAAPKPAAKTGGGKLFGSDSDDDAAPKPKAPPVVASPVGKKAVAKPANKLFASDSD